MRRRCSSTPRVRRPPRRGEPHRQAADQYARALRFAANLPLAEAPASSSSGLTSATSPTSMDEAIEAIQHALDEYEELGDVRAQGEALRSLAQMLWSAGRPDEAETAARSAVASLEQLPPGRELAMAYAVLASRCMNAEDTEEASTWGTRAPGACRAARRAGDRRARAQHTRDDKEVHGCGWSADARSKPRSRGA